WMIHDPSIIVMGNERDLKDGESPESPGNLVGFKYVGKQNGFRVYENQCYIPMGFAFDYYCKQNDIDSRSDVNKVQMLMKALVLDADTAIKYHDYIEYFSFLPSDFTSTNYIKDCNERRAECCDSFSYSDSGFDATIKLGKKKLVFFSVPYDQGWKAQVNGNDTDIIKVDFGFMAVPCEQGENTIKFTYETPYLKIGVILTGTGFLVWTGYVVYFRKREKPVPEPSGDDDNDDTDTDSDTDITDETSEEVPDGTDPLATEDEPIIDENAGNAAESEEENVLEGENDNDETGL
ncbi:MAG: YfhO family protein, partial [Ruminococcus sp.]|nr:YfhO family protein [Ruminococcus sp.]